LQTDLSETKNLAEANPDGVERLATLMKKYISEGRSTVGAPQKNEAPMSVDESSGGKRKKGKKAKNKSDKEEALALDPRFD
jgi:hypothetical protein